MPDIIFDPQLTTGDMAALEKFASNVKPNIAIEVGSWKGLSTWILSKYCAVLYCVDTWKAADSTPHMQEDARQRDIFSIFRQNLTQFNLMERVKPMMMTSMEAARIVPDGIFDLVFIDCDHIYKSVHQDIMSWLPKVRPGGILCGHDCEILWKDADRGMRNQIDQNLEIDFIQDAICPGRGIHPGVTKAVHDIFNDEVQILEGSSIWVKQK